MNWISEVDIIEFLNQHNYEVKKENITRWHDQKCTPDVLCIIADCILEYINSHKDVEYFKTSDIWFNQYTLDFVESMFKKPSPDKEIAKSEYDKFFQQPMELLAHAKILEKIKQGNRNLYKVLNYPLLEYISLRDKNALKFLSLYNEKVLRDSDMFSYFSDFFNNQTKQNFNRMKQKFEIDMKRRTRITTNTEIDRIFPKVLHPMAFYKNSYGSFMGHMSRDKVTLDMVMYNRLNFRDIYAQKPKDKTRNEYLEEIGYKPDERVFIYESNKAKKQLRKFNDKFFESKSEINDDLSGGIATNMHHIFPANQFEELSGYLENLIALTASQHFQEAHPNNNTQIIDESFQQICLIAKAGMIKWCYENIPEDNIYSFDLFMDVLTIGLDDESFRNIKFGDYDLVCRQINMSYLNRQ